ncbi:unnamed protein product [Cuscuta epithymum]|uniref:Endoglucanase n=1 Tax=Cuscuta epithymum TaxID=186058 RepID=A0AAV0ECR8_9ASTE|nr:unnamed protein product [Cuscuta epithymum]
MALEVKSQHYATLKIVAFFAFITILTATKVKGHDYGKALSYSILFFEGQRSGKLPPNQRVLWRNDSALDDGFEGKVDLEGGYYDAGDNVKYSFPMAFTTTMLAWSVLEYEEDMSKDELPHALEAIRWATDFLLKATNKHGVVFAMVGDPNADHNCWERPEDMDTPRTVYQVNETSPGSEVSAEIAAALAAASLALNDSDPHYSHRLLKRARQVFKFADKFRGSYNNSIKDVCPFYCDYSGYQDELLWGAAWLYKATKKDKYWEYVKQNINNITTNGSTFGWDSKHPGINVLISQYVLSSDGSTDKIPFIPNADAFVCAVLPESPNKVENFTSGGILYHKDLMGNLQSPIALSYLILTYGRYLERYNSTGVQCGELLFPGSKLIDFAKSQVDYVLGDNPMNMSYMVGYGEKYPQRIHHRASSMPSIQKHPEHIGCKDGTIYFNSSSPNPNLLLGAVVGGPNDGTDNFIEDRMDAGKLECATYINGPLVGLLAYFKANHYSTSNTLLAS